MRVKVGLLALLVLVLVACGGPKNKLVGTWTGSYGMMSGDVTYNNDGTMLVAMTINDQRMPGVVVKAKGNYKLEGDTLGVTMTSADVENLPPALEARKDMVISQLSQGMQVGTENKAKIEFPDADTYKTTSPTGLVRTLTRKK